MRSVIFAGGILRPGAAVDRALARADLILAADSGTLTALQYGRVPDFVVGDFDSLPMSLEELRTRGSQVIQAAVAKNETDTELAIQTALDHGADDITILGGLEGPRFDHTMANILLLAGYEPFPLRIIDGPAISWLLRGPGSTDIHGQRDDLLSLLPLTAEAKGVRTTSLHYPLHGETLLFGKPRGVSNVLTEKHAIVSLDSGLLLVIHTAASELHE